MLCHRVPAVRLAWQSGDKPAVRAGLRLLSAEAELLAVMEPLPIGCSTLAAGTKVAAERDALGRIG